MRLLMIDSNPRLRAQVQHHLARRWPHAELVTHDPTTHGPFAPEFLAQGFDAVLLDQEWPGTQGIAWLEDFARRASFAPIVFLSKRDDDELARRALMLGAGAVVRSERLDHRKLIEVLAAAKDRQDRARIRWRNSTEGREAQTFSGARIPGYRRIRRVAGGPVSDLYLAESEGAGALVAIKVARDKRLENQLDQSFKRFLQEYEIVQRIRHPSIVRLYDLGISDEHAYLVMEYFRAGDLRKLLRTSGVSPRQALDFALQLARGLEAIHQSGVLHRDLKPGNVMLRDDGTLALIDFGLAKHEALELEVTDQGLIFGTPHYMSPEQGHGEPIDARSDLYSLGVILFEMLARRKPFVADNPMAIIYKHRKSPVPKLPESVANLQPLIDRLLAKLPADRFDSGAAAAEAIELVLRDFTQPAPVVT